MQLQPRTVHRHDSGYPERLRSLGERAPDPIYQAGAWQPAARSVAIVGARAANSRAIDFARRLGRLLAAAEVDVISGGAIGIDAAAHEGAVGAGGATVAVLGTGLDHLYPERNIPLFKEILARGALLTSFASRTPVRRGNFPARNTLIAALADLTVVVQADTQSGSLYTAYAALKLGRRLVAMPGSPGTHALIQAGATGVNHPKDVLELLENRPLPDPILDGKAARVYAQLTTVPRELTTLASSSGFSISTCAMLLGELELGGWVSRSLSGYLRLR